MTEQSTPVPTANRIVSYTLDAKDMDTINAQRVKRAGSGVPIFRGNEPHEGDVLPLIIVRVFSDTTVNGQVFLDGDDTLWKTSVSLGDGPGHFAWPARA